MRIWHGLKSQAVNPAFAITALLSCRPNARHMAMLTLFVATCGCGPRHLETQNTRVPSEDRVELESRVAALRVGAIPQVTDGEFVASDVCAECHPKMHATWHESFHRSMTQVVSSETVLAPIKDTVLHSRGRDYRFHRQGDDFYVDMVDPDWDAAVRAGELPDGKEGSAPRVTRKLVMSTGSHHYQTYWVNSSHGNELWQVPWVYHLGEQRWLPAEDAFVRPPDGPRRLTTWNNVCIQCHAVRGQPGLELATEHFTSQVVELGIACEACHGPGRKHVEHHRSKDTGVASTPPDPTIVNPANLSHERSAQVCGQCHSYFSFGDARFWQTGFTYRPGDDLDATRMIHDFDQQHVQSRPQLQTGYWGDGTMRIAGREFSSMDDSTCFQQGDLSCISCHSMHAYEQTDDQLAPGMRGSDACLQCHDAYRDKVAAHTHHAADSVGSDCYNCHMPHTSFGLLKATRSHRIDSPSAIMTSTYGRPNACNLCHQDKPLQWTAEHLSSWYGQEPVTLAAEYSEVASSLQMLLRGDAVQRSVIAWNYGWEPAQQASTGTWQVPFLSLMLIDPYAAVRSTAYAALRTYPGFSDFQYDFLAPAEQRSRAMREAITKWRGTLSGDTRWATESVLLDPAGGMLIERVQPLLQQRDERPIELPE